MRCYRQGSPIFAWVPPHWEQQVNWTLRSGSSASVHCLTLHHHGRIRKAHYGWMVWMIERLLHTKTLRINQGLLWHRHVGLVFRTCDLEVEVNDKRDKVIWVLCKGTGAKYHKSLRACNLEQLRRVRQAKRSIILRWCSLIEAIIDGTRARGVKRGMGTHQTRLCLRLAYCVPPKPSYTCYNPSSDRKREHLYEVMGWCASHHCTKVSKLRTDSDEARQTSRVTVCVIISDKRSTER